MLLFWVGGFAFGKNQHEPKPARTLSFIENKGQWANASVFSASLPGGRLHVERNALHLIFQNQDDVNDAFKHPRPFGDDFKPRTVRFHAVRINFYGSNSGVISSGEQVRKEYYNYFMGQDPTYWRSNVKAYGQVSLHRLYDGIDAVLYYSGNGSLKYDMVVSPGADPSKIKMMYEGQESIKINNGSLYVTTSVNKWIEERPYAYQVVNGVKRQIVCDFTLEGNFVSFAVGSYNKQLPLIIDPILVFSTYSGSSVDNFGHTATYDKDGNLYAAGIARDPTNFPNGTYPVTPGAFQQIWGGGDGSWPQDNFPCDISISKYLPDGSDLIYATYLGGNHNDYPHSIVTDKNNNLILFGTTLSPNFPTTTGAYDRIYNDSFDIIVSKLSADGTQLLGSTFVGGSEADGINLADSLRMNYADEFRGEVIIDTSNNIIVATSTSSADFPVTTGAYQTLKNTRQEGCIFKLDSNLKSLKASTFIGRAEEDAIYSVDIDNLGNIYFAGGTQSKTFGVSPNTHLGNYKGGSSDGFIGKLDPQLSVMQNLRYWGSNAYDQAYFIRLDPAGNPVVFGQNYDSIPVINADYRIRHGSLFITKFKPALDSIIFSTVIGDTVPGNRNNALAPSAFMVDECGVIYGSVWGGGTNTAGWFGSNDPSFSSSTSRLPLTPDALQSVTDGSDFYLFVLDKNLDKLEYGTYFGEIGQADHVDGGTSRFDKKGIIYQSVCASCGNGTSGSFTTTPNSFSPFNLSPRCSNASFKIDFRKSDVVYANFDFTPKKFCIDSYIVVKYTNKSFNGKQHFWYVNGVLKDTSLHFTDTISTIGTFVVKLVEIDSSRCVIIDSTSQSFTTGRKAYASFTSYRDTCSPVVNFINTTTPPNTPIKWYFGNGNTSTAQSVTYQFPANGLYQVLLVANPGTACEDSSIFNIQYDSTAHIMRTSFSPLNAFDCEPGHLDLTNTSNHKLKQRWYINDTLVSTGVDLDTTLAKGRYTVKLVSEDSSTCNISDSMILPFIVVAEAFPDFLYTQDPCSLNVQFTDSSQVFPNDTVLYFWDFGNGKTSTKKNPFVEFDTSGTYKVRLTINKDLDCPHFIEKNVPVVVFPGVLNSFFTAQPDHSCTPGIITFINQSTNDQTREWYYNNVLFTTSNTYTDTFTTDTVIEVKLIVRNPSTCLPADTFVKTITIENTTMSMFTVQRDTCSNLVIFTNQSSSDNGEPLTYTWYFGDGDSSTLISPTHAYLVDSVYTVTLITNKGSFCADTSETQISYSSTSHLLNVDFNLDDSIFCNPAIFKATNISLNGESFQWYLNDDMTSSDSIYTDTLTAPGTYKLKLLAVDPATCKKRDSLIKTLVVSRFGESDFEIARDSCSLIVQFKNLSGAVSGIPNTYKWYFGDGDSSAEVNPLHIYKETNIYTITLLTNPESACADTTVKTFLIDGDTANEIFIPNAFTPNNDGLNDCYRIRGVSAKCDEYKVQIYNRWGEIYYESTDPSQCWNGKNEAGTPASGGVYYYIMSIHKRDQEKMEKHGTITLIRD